MSVDNFTNGDAPTSKQKRPRIILIYALAGPPVGGIVTLLAMLIYFSITSGLETWLGNVREEPIQTLLSLPLMFVGFAVYGYIFGGIQALLTGSFISLKSGKDGKFGYGLAIIAPTFVALAVTVVLIGVFQIRSGHIFWEAPLYLGGIGIAASVIVRFLFRKQFSPKIF